MSTTTFTMPKTTSWARGGQVIDLDGPPLTQAEQLELTVQAMKGLSTEQISRAQAALQSLRVSAIMGENEEKAIPPALVQLRGVTRMSWAG